MAHQQTAQGRGDSSLWRAVDVSHWTTPSCATTTATWSILGHGERHWYVVNLFGRLTRRASEAADLFEARIHWQDWHLAETERLKATRKQILDGAGISQAHLESATVLHRRNRRTIEVESRKGSAAVSYVLDSECVTMERIALSLALTACWQAVMSATTQYRFQRKLPPRGEQDHMVNPSDLSLPITSETINEGDSRGKIQHASKSATKTMHTNRVERTAFRSLSLIVVIATAAAFGTMFHSWVRHACSTSTRGQCSGPRLM